MAFDAENHTYTYRRQRMPSVSELVTEPSAFWTDESRDRGKALHKYALRRDLGEPMQLTDLPELWRGYGRALDRAYDALQPHWTEWETPRVNSKLKYGGTRDRVGVLAALATVAIVDFKTGAPAEYHADQLAGYDLLDGLDAMNRKLFTIYLQDDGWYRLVDVTDPRAKLRFRERLSEYWSGTQRRPIANTGAL